MSDSRHQLAALAAAAAAGLFAGGSGASPGAPHITAAGGSPGARTVARAAPTEAPPAQDAERYNLRGERVAVYNLAGRVEVKKGAGPGVTVTVRRGGPDADRLSVATGEIDGQQTLRVLYPSDQVVYGEHDGETTVEVEDDGTFGQGDGDEVHVRGDGSGLRAHANLVVEVPEGGAAEVRLGVGEVGSTDVASDLTLDVAAGPVSVDGHRGTLVVDTGAGSAEVSDVEGDLEVDTGSGSVQADAVRGDRITLDTGSGRIRGRDLECDELEADTGSGSISLERVSARRLRLDTGSGSVRLGLTSDVDDLQIDTGSGSVDLAVPAGFGSRLEIDTGSGGVSLQGIQADIRRLEDGAVRGALGDGDGETTIDTGSGGVTIRPSGG